MTVNLAEIIGMETQGARNFMQSKSGGMIDLTEIINLLKVNNELLHEIAVKDSSTYLDKKKFRKN